MALFKKNKNKIGESFGDRVLLAFTTLLLLLVLVLVGYPVLYVISSSFSSNEALNAGKVVLFPVDFTLNGYKFVFGYDVVWRGFRNSILYTVGGVMITMSMNTLAAYPLSKPYYQGRGTIMGIFFASTLFGAGMIPTFLVKTSLGLFNNVFAVLLTGAVGVRNMIILRTCFRSSIPNELYDAAAIDGANDFQTMFKIALPLAKATLSVLTLYTAVGSWNEYFTSMIYLPDREELHPLQLVLRPILSAAGKLDVTNVSSSDLLASINDGTQGVKFALIIIATVPVLVMYFVVQKYFEKGVMVSSVKG